MTAALEAAATSDTAVGAVREVLLDRRADAPTADARFFAADCAAAWQLSDDDRDSLVLVVDELVANAVHHAIWPPQQYMVPVRLALSGTRLSLEVRDPDPTMPVWPGTQTWDLTDLEGDGDPDDEQLVRHHGLALVFALCDGRLSAKREASGKAVRAALVLGGTR
jgi:two-component sensor histidine kinase